MIEFMAILFSAFISYSYSYRY